MKSARFLLAAVICFFASTILHAQYLSGTYKTDFGTLTLVQNGTQVSGTYDYMGGRIEGTLNGLTLSGWWYQTNGKGRLIFAFNPDGSGFTGNG